MGKVTKTNVVSALMNNFDTARAATEAAINSEGSAMRENERYMQSLSGKIGQFKAQFQEFSNVAMDTDFLKGIVDSGTKALDIFTSLLKTLGVIPTALGAIGAVKILRNLD